MDTTTRKAPANVIDKIWAQHVVADLGGGACVLHIDRLMLHDRGGGLVLRKLSDAGTPVARPESVFATVDHVVETKPGRTDRTSVPRGATFIGELRAGARRHALRLFDVNDPGQGIVRRIRRPHRDCRPGRHHLRVPVRHTACPDGRRLGPSTEPVARPVLGSRRTLRCDTVGRL
ncbi:aconitase family protein [Nocardia sp. NPDC023852]|uniref:aconitase family protein n=1 Tax=Nocardia sp. NPDC023852 TaxID=3154697 RepID=UPI0033D7FBC6